MRLVFGQQPPKDKTCKECIHCIKENYRSGRTYYKCGQKKFGEKGRATKARRAACITFEEGQGEEVYAGC